MIHRAIIPLAGKGTRLMPVTAVLPKALFPLVGREGAITCVLEVILDQVFAAGIEEVALVVSPGQQELIDRYLDAVRQSGVGSIPDRIVFIEQAEPRGFGDAVLCGSGFVAEEPFLVLLGDHVQIQASGAKPCVRQVTEAFKREGGVAMVGVHEVPVSELAKVGVAKGEPVGDGVYRCADFVEKPDLQTANGRLRTPGLGEGIFLGHCGIYAFTPEIFECLQEESQGKGHGLGEVELAAAQQRLRRRHPRDYFLLRIAGKAYDMGTPGGYYRTLEAWKSAGGKAATVRR